MKREILFRAKRMDNGEWIEGYLLKVTIGDKIYYLIFGDDFAFDGDNVQALAHAYVDPATVGQYTGLTDKNGKRIFEGDIIKNEYSSGEFQYFRIVCDEKRLCWTFENKWKMTGNLYAVIGNMEILGNIHDNPELLEGGVNDG